MIILKTALVFYSRTGNTKKVAEKFKNIDLLEIKSASNNPNQQQVTLIESPDISKYDHLIFASPVHGFQLCKVMKAYLNQLSDLKDKTIDIYVTHYFRFSWLGGIQALKQMRKIIESKGGQVEHQTSINWKSHKRDTVIEAMVEQYLAE